MKFKNQLSDEDAMRIIDLFYKNKSYEDICKEVDCSERAIAFVLKNNGIEARKRNRYTLNESYFDNIDTEEKAYWLGFLFADGYIGNEKTNNIVLSLADHDKEMLCRFKDAIEISLEITEKISTSNFSNNSKSVRLSFSSKKMCDNLRDKGMIYKKENRLRNLPNIKKDFLRHFFRGLFDADGSFSVVSNTFTKNGKVYSYKKPALCIISTLTYLKAFQKEANIGGHISDSKSDGMKYLQVSKKEDVSKIYHYFYDNSNIFLPRKYQKICDFI